MLPEVPVGSQIIAEEGYRKKEDRGPQGEEEKQEGDGRVGEPGKTKRKEFTVKTFLNVEKGQLGKQRGHILLSG